MSTPQVLPHERGHPSKLSQGASQGSVGVSPRSSGQGRVKGSGQDHSPISQPITIDDDNDLPIDSGALASRWNELKMTQGFASNEETARFLMNSWDEMNIQKPYCIKLEKTTVRDFEMFQKQIQRSADEIIQFYMALGVEPGYSAIPVTEDVMNMFIMLKSSLKLSSTDLMKHLFEVYERYIKNGDQPSRIALEYSMRKAVREEMLRLVHEGVVPIMNNKQHVHGPDIQAESAARNETPSVHSNMSPEKTKSHPRHVQVQDNNQPDPYYDLMGNNIQSEPKPVQDQAGNKPYTQLTGDLSVAVSSPENIVLSDKDIMQYNYVIQSSTTEPTFSVENPALNGIPGTSHDTHHSALHTQQGTITGKENSTKLPEVGTKVDKDCSRKIPEQQTSQNLPSSSTYEEETQTQIKTKKVSEGQRSGKVVKGTMLFCPHCDYKCVTPSTMKNHIKLHTGISFPCPLCPLLYAEENKLKKHIQFKHDKSIRFKCKVCADGRQFASTEGLEYHFKHTHQNDFLYWCDQCCKGFQQEVFYLSHLKKHVDVEMPSVHVENVEDCPKRPDDTINTEGRSRELDTSENLFELIQITNIESGEQFVCDLTQEDDSQELQHSNQCSYESSKPSLLKPHTLTQENKLYNCRYCQESFTTESKLMLHRSLKHNNKPPFKCNMCSRTFLSKAGWSYHQEAAHCKIYKFNCDKCNMGFNKVKKFRAHKKTHVVTRRLVCEKCNLSFAYASLLMSHKRVCSGKIPEKNRNGLQLDLFPCKECPEKYATLQGLKDHCLDVHRTVIKEGGNQTKYLCECGMEFNLQTLYDFHKRTCRMQNRDIRNISLPVYPS